MRVIAGKFKGRKLTALRGERVRPTSDRVKESLFSILRNYLQDAKFLDLCSGSGNIGIEALSRGVKSVTFVDKSFKSISVIKRNLEKCDISLKSDQIELICKKAQTAIELLSKKGEKFGLIYFDPPYDSDIYIETLNQIDKTDILAKDGLIIAEHSHDKEIPESIGSLLLKETRRYGNTKLSFFLQD